MDDGGTDKAVTPGEAAWWKGGGVIEIESIRDPRSENVTCLL